jgi:hypothetical protein
MKQKDLCVTIIRIVNIYERNDYNKLTREAAKDTKRTYPMKHTLHYHNYSTPSEL